VSDAEQARPRRPWYLTIALYALCIIGASGMSTGCNDLDFLRGSQVLPDIISKTLEEPASSFVRTGMLREKARLEAIAEHHEDSFPVSLARLLLSVVLLAAAGACLLRRGGSRKFALQAIGANAILAIIAFKVLAPVHESMADALAIDAVDNLPLKASAIEREHSIEEYRGAFIWLDGVRFIVFELGVFAAIAVTLTRRSSIVFLDSDHAANDPDQPDDDRADDDDQAGA
jgi:hypothetical protein